MTISLYDATVAGYLRGLTGLAAVLDKGLAHCVETGGDANELVAARLHETMAPLAFQIWSVKHHSLGAIEGCMASEFRPPSATPDMGYASLQRVVADAMAKLEALAPDDIEVLQGRDMVFRLGERSLPFTAERFLLSFSIPNFHFHATTAYDILRSRGVPLGKRDYLGPHWTKA